MKISTRFTSTAVISLVVFLYACSGSSQSSIPSQWESGMKLTMSYGGGMRYYSYELVIKDSNSIYTENDGGKISTTALRLTVKELNDLLAALRKYRFDKIKTSREGPIYDKGTETIILEWKDHRISVSDGSMDVIAKSSVEDFAAIRKYIDELVQRVKAP